MFQEENDLEMVGILMLINYRLGLGSLLMRSSFIIGWGSPKPCNSG